MVSTYHMLLRTAALTVALLLLFDSGLISPLSKSLSQNTQLYLANVVGISVGVESTELNQLTAQMTARERELDVRESAVKERELSVGITESGGQASGGLSTYILSLILFILIVLILLNYTLDYLRAKQLRHA